MISFRLTERIMEEKEETSPEQTNPVSVVDPSQVPLPASELSGASLCESQYSASPSIHSQSSDADEDAEDSEYASGDDEDLRDDDESMMQYNDEGEMFSMDADEDNVSILGDSSAGCPKMVLIRILILIS